MNPSVHTGTDTTPGYPQIATVPVDDRIWQGVMEVSDKKEQDMQAHSSTGTRMQSWGEVVALLNRAADIGVEAAEIDPALHSTAWWADLVAAAAVQLLPPEHDHALNEVVLPDHLLELGFAAIVQAAHEAALAIPTDQLPAHARIVIAELTALASEVEP